MSVIAIVSSPQIGANTDMMVQAAAEGVKSVGKDVKIYYINKMKNARPCQACDFCKAKGQGCAVKDDIKEVLDAIIDSDGVILSVPVYFGQPCAQYRMFEDRLYSYLKGDFSSICAPKKFAVFTAAGTAGADTLADEIEKRMTGFFKFECIGKVSAITKNDKKAVENNADIKAQCKAIGAKF
ncbi:MAG: flavodoxin family protein [Candidatus Methanomethylophilus sp.]|jgi:multimeric flavodoxin WrbA|nr:flavodoxin family protein [Methanomethylophilus sp.]MCI2093445.1 flavodoxin family protein [Methanomethylophilus sp.]MEE3401285.1 flavodoxin family protein [Methanomethylophilus sp.]WII09191.1 flavodoxin family protein [Methanomassiliicoccales archaeon LGM-DZ1]